MLSIALVTCCRATGAIFLYNICIYLTDRVDTYRIVLNVSTRFYFSVYATISLDPRASLLPLTRAPCLPTPCTHLGHSQLRQYQVYNPPFLVLERNQLLLRFASTCDDHSLGSRPFPRFNCVWAENVFRPRTIKTRGRPGTEATTTTLFFYGIHNLLRYLSE